MKVVLHRTMASMPPAGIWHGGIAARQSGATMARACPAAHQLGSQAPAHAKRLGVPYAPLPGPSTSSPVRCSTMLQ